jgi:hypothetical protein
MMDRAWEADPTALFEKRLGMTAAEQGLSNKKQKCPDIWQLTNGDIAVIGRDLTESYAASLPEGVSLGADERLVVIPGLMLRTAKKDIPDA